MKHTRATRPFAFRRSGIGFVTTKVTVSQRAIPPSVPLFSIVKGTPPFLALAPLNCISRYLSLPYAATAAARCRGRAELSSGIDRTADLMLLCNQSKYHGAAILPRGIRSSKVIS
jgi:hypothetical protein